MSKYVKICKKKGTWKGRNNFTLSLEKVHQVALFYTTGLDQKAKWKSLGMQLQVTFLLFYGILI